MFLPEVEDLYSWETQLLEEPLILLMTGIVLVRPESMSHPVDVIDDRTGEIVCGIGFVFCPPRQGPTHVTAPTL